MNVLVLTEHLQGSFTDATFEALAVGRRLGGPVEAVLAGPASMAGQLGGADTVLVVEDPALESFIPEAHARVFAALVAEREPEVVLVPYTSMGMDVASEVSMRCGLPLVSYCTDVRVDEGLSATCRLYAGKIEVDVDVPLTALGLPDTSIFANYTWLKSELTDPVTGEKRRFRDQPEYIYNIGLIQNLPSWNSTFGFSYQKRGESFAFDYAEIQSLAYEGNLEAFWETRLSKSTVLRFTGANLLNAEKLEKVGAYLPNIAGELDETEIEREKSGRLFLMTLRQAF